MTSYEEGVSCFSCSTANTLPSPSSKRHQDRQISRSQSLHHLEHQSPRLASALDTGHSATWLSPPPLSPPPSQFKGNFQSQRSGCGHLPSCYGQFGSDYGVDDQRAGGGHREVDSAGHWETSPRLFRGVNLRWYSGHSYQQPESDTDPGQRISQPAWRGKSRKKVVRSSKAMVERQASSSEACGVRTTTHRELQKSLSPPHQGRHLAQPPDDSFSPYLDDQPYLPYAQPDPDFETETSFCSHQHFLPQTHHLQTSGQSISICDLHSQYNPPSAKVFFNKSDKTSSDAINFNNRVLPHGEFSHKTPGKLDISIQNDFENIRKYYDKDNHSESCKNQFSVKPRNKDYVSASDVSSLPRQQIALHKFELGSKGGGVDPNKLTNHNPLGRGFEEFIKRGTNVNESGKSIEEMDRRRRKRNHIIFLMVMLFVVALGVAATIVVTTTILPGEDTLATDSAEQSYDVVFANLTLKILNRKFEEDLLTSSSAAFRVLAIPYSTQLDRLFLMSSLSTVYVSNHVTGFSPGSVIATSSLTFLDAGLITSSEDVENVIKSADLAKAGKMADARRLGDYVICQTCAEVSIEFTSVKIKPEVLLYKIDPALDLLLEYNTTEVGVDTAATSAAPTTTITASATSSSATAVVPISSSDSSTVVTSAPSSSSLSITTSTTKSTIITSIPTTATTTTTTESTITDGSLFNSSQSLAYTTPSSFLDTSHMPIPLQKLTTRTADLDTSTETTPSLTEMTTYSWTMGRNETDRATEDQTTDVRMESTNGFLNEGLTRLTCSAILVSDWSALNIRRQMSASSYADVVSVNLESKVTWFDPSLSARALTHFRSQPPEVIFDLWIYVLKCGDEGNYTCSVVTEGREVSARHAQMQVFARPQVPLLTVPGTVDDVTPRSSTVTCETQVGRDSATLTLYRKLQNETEFTEVNFTSSVVQDLGACVKQMMGSYEIPDPVDMNGAVFKCDVTSTSESEVKVQSDEQEFLILPGDTCAGQGSVLLSHPSLDCRHFVLCAQDMTSVLSCGPGLCFNVTSLRCDILLTEVSTRVCAGKDSHMLPHPSLCNKYIRCVSGREITQHCPVGELYIGNGTCTPNITASNCYQNL